MGAEVLSEHVSKKYQAGSGAEPTEALHSVSFSLGRGSFTALLGPSGCGKSTLLNLLGSLDKPTSGRILVDGQDIARFSETEQDRYRRRKAATIFQFFNLLPAMTALENISLPLLFDGVPAREAVKRAKEKLAEVGLLEKAQSYPYQLSGGQMQRVAIARALATEPDLLLADEPTGNLDSRAGARVLDLVEMAIEKHGVTVIMATHSTEAAARAGTVLQLRDGHVVPS